MNSGFCEFSFQRDSLLSLAKVVLSESISVICYEANLTALMQLTALLATVSNVFKLSCLFSAYFWSSFQQQLVPLQHLVPPQHLVYQEQGAIP